MNNDSPRWVLRAVGIGAGEQRERVGTGAERAPRLHAVDHPTRLAVGAGRGGGGHLDAGHVASVVRLGDGHGGHHLGGGQQRQPVLLLFLGATLHERPRQDLRAGDERSADAEARLRQFLGRGDHRDVLGVAALAVAAVLGGDAEAECAELGEPRDDLLGDVAVGAMDVLGMWRDHVGGECAERVGHHGHVVVEVTRARLVGE